MARGIMDEYNTQLVCFRSLKMWGLVPTWEIKKLFLQRGVIHLGVSSSFNENIRNDYEGNATLGSRCEDTWILEINDALVGDRYSNTLQIPCVFGDRWDIAYRSYQFNCRAVINWQLIICCTAATFSHNEENGELLIGS